MRKLFILFFYIFSSTCQADNFTTVSIITLATTVLDVESSYLKIGRCDCSEKAPVLHALIPHGRLAAYGVTFGVDFLALALAHKAREQGNTHWWITPVIISGTHGVGTTLNLTWR